MATHSPKRQSSRPGSSVIQWLLDSDPSIRWQVMRDLIGDLLERHLFRRLSTSEVIERDREGETTFTDFAFPTWWHYDVLRGLEYLRRAGATPDERMDEAIELVESKRDRDGRWLLEVQYPGEMPIDMEEGEGRPSRWNTLRALRVLDWYSARA